MINIGKQKSGESAIGQFGYHATPLIRTDQFPKTNFLDSENLKTYKPGKNSTSKILTENNTTSFS